MRIFIYEYGFENVLMHIIIHIREFFIPVHISFHPPFRLTAMVVNLNGGCREISCITAGFVPAVQKINKRVFMH